jgi:hypothetical protein
MRLGILLIGTCSVFAACRRDNNGYMATGPLARVLVDSVGGVHFNSQPITIAALTDSLRELQAVGGAVVYSRTPAGVEPNAQQSPVVDHILNTITGLRLPVRLVRPDSLLLPDSVLRR